MQKTQIHFEKLPYYLTFFMIVDEANNCVKVEIHSRIHVNKVHHMPNSWSIEFVRDCTNRFRDDVFSYAIKTYGLKPSPVTYS